MTSEQLRKTAQNKRETAELIREHDGSDSSEARELEREANQLDEKAHYWEIDEAEGKDWRNPRYDELLEDTDW